MLERTPPELSADIMKNGIHLTGDGARLFALDRFISESLGMPVLLARDPGDCCILGIGYLTENIQLVIQLEKWVEGKEYERVGMEETYTEILGIRVPCVTIPVMPGRNLAVIIEAATMNNRQKKMGYNAAAELNKRVFEQGAPEVGSSFSTYY